MRGSNPQYVSFFLRGGGETNKNMKYDVVLIIKDLYGFNSSEAKDKALEMIKNQRIEKSDLDVFCHQVGGGKMRL